MTISGLGFTIILLCHWITDFVLQNDWMALNKSKQPSILLAHCAVSSLPMAMFVMALSHASFWIVLPVLFVSHFFIDLVSSKVCEHYYTKGDRHNFFVMIGFDQFLHMSILAILYYP